MFHLMVGCTFLYKLIDDFYYSNNRLLIEKYMPLKHNF